MEMFPGDLSGKRTGGRMESLMGRDLCAFILFGIYSTLLYRIYSIYTHI